jgi:hypothetical protein
VAPAPHGVELGSYSIQTRGNLMKAATQGTGWKERRFQQADSAREWVCWFALEFLSLFLKVVHA